jgi:uncharacterized membrane protein YhhN
MNTRGLNRGWGAALMVSVLLCAALAIASAAWALDLPALNFVFKPLTTALILVYAWPRGREHPLERRGVLVGLGLSWVGDVALLWPQQGFLPGLVSFLLAHLAYLWAFTRQRPLAVRRLPFAVYACVAAVVLGRLWPGVPAGLRAPVLVYVLCLSAMAAQAAAVALAGSPRGRVLAAGGALFMLSDALLATNKFAVALPLANLWILASYWAAQCCIASWLGPRQHRNQGGSASALGAMKAGSPPAR